jgi:hypothetical protein
VKYVRAELAQSESLSLRFRRAIGMRKPAETYWTLLEGGGLALLHYGDEDATVTLNGGRTVTLKPYSIWLGEE